MVKPLLAVQLNFLSRKMYSFSGFGFGFGVSRVQSHVFVSCVGSAQKAPVAGSLGAASETRTGGRPCRAVFGERRRVAEVGGQAAHSAPAVVIRVPPDAVPFGGDPQRAVGRGSGVHPESGRSREDGGLTRQDRARCQKEYGQQEHCYPKKISFSHLFIFLWIWSLLKFPYLLV